MKRLLSFAGMLIVAACSDASAPAGLAPESATLVSTTMFAKNGVAVCHVTGNGKYNLLNISENALPAHLAHGDGRPGQGFTANCAKSASLTITVGSVDWVGQLIQWTVVGDQAGVTYLVELPPGGPAFGSVPGNGSGSYSLELNSCSAMSFRIRAVDSSSATLGTSASVSGPLPCPPVLLPPPPPPPPFPGAS